LSDGDVKIIQAKWVAPMDRPILRDAGVAIGDGKIISVDASSELRREFPHAEVMDLPRSVVMPGLVNAHVHLELSNCEQGERPTSFIDWIASVRGRMRIEPGDEERSITMAVNAGITQSLKFGVTCVGDISNFIEISRRALSNSSIRAVSYGEALGLAKLRQRFVTSLDRATDLSVQSDRLRIGLSPHSPYTVDLAGFGECLSFASRLNLPLATHLAESPDEEIFLKEHGGGFRELWNKLNLWEDPVETFKGSPIAFAKSIGLLDYPTLLAHVNYCTDAELDMLAGGKASVVYCPRTHEYFGHRPHRFREMLARGINVAVGTDSCASSPDLNLVDDLRLIRKFAPELDARSIWEMATVRAARSLDFGEMIGTLAPGKIADIASFEVESNDPLEEVLRCDQLPDCAWVGGNVPQSGV
jgi:cytosine/adenosine deaminase-related metal-dependent hydrolase